LNGEITFVEKIFNRKEPSVISELFTRRDFSARLVGLLSGLSLAENAFGFTASGQAESAGDQEISRTAESIHQEVVFQASRKRVYEALTDAKQFTKITSLSPVMNAAPAEISREAGGAFTCFGGHIVGRQVELVPNERIVQAWRVMTWDQGVYSIAKFELKEQGSETRLVFDHAGFPGGKAEHLAAGWKTNYWEPLHKYLSSPNSA
jgi:activator of HSP90 ATPase